MIIRKTYLDKILPYIDMPIVKILTGIRRCGKSTILKMVMEYLKESKGVLDDQIISINFDNIRYEYIADKQALYDTIAREIKEGRNDNKRTYVFLDEIQEVDGWAKAINSLMMDFDVDIYITGSNSRMLSSEIHTVMTARYITIEVFTLSFAEFLEFKKSYRNIRDIYTEFLEYLEVGGFPIVNLHDMNKDQAYSIIMDIYKSIIFTDIVQRNNISAINQFEKIVRFVFDNIGKTFSGNSVFKYYKEQQRAVPLETIYNYLSMLEKAFIVGRAQRYDICGKELLKTFEKYYLADSSLKYAVLGYSPSATSSMLENIVYLELRRRGYSVSVGKFADKEIDFVATFHDTKIYIQVATTLEGEKVSQREFENLQMVKDNFNKYIVVLDKYQGDNKDGIKVVQIAEFLLQEEY